MHLPESINSVVSIGPRTNSYANFTYTHVTYHRIVCEDSHTAPLHEHFDAATDFIHAQIQEGKRVLVHCQAGISRSATICIAYLIRFHHLSWTAAYMVVKDARAIVCPNLGFLTQLRDYETTLFSYHMRLDTFVSCQMRHPPPWGRQSSRRRYCGTRQVSRPD